jgi:hypothetical protein
MQNNDDFHSQLLKYGIDLGFLLSGFFGAVILSIKNRKKKLSKTISCIFAGTLCANYMTPLILHFAPTNIQEKGKYAVAFMMGYIGLKGLEAIVDIANEYIKERYSKKTD